MKNLLVTGGCGFIGTNFIRYLFEDAGYAGRIVNYDKLTYAGNPGNLMDVRERFPERYIFVHGDLCDANRLADAFDRFEVDAVCHFAAESHVDRSIAKPDDFIQSNIVGAFHLLEATRKRPDRVRLFHHISTDEVFGSLGPQGLFTEETPYRPNSPYSASKASSDHLVRAYHHTYGLPVTISNCSNNYGPYQFPEKMMPLMMLNALKNESLPVYGDGLHIRDWLYVTDHCRAVWKIMRQGRRGETYNIGGENEIANLRLVEAICDLADEMHPEPGLSRRRLVSFVKDRPGHDRRYAIDCSKLRNELDWRPLESFDSGIRKTMRWYMDRMEWVDAVSRGDHLRWVREHYG